MAIAWVRPCNCAGLSAEHEFGAPGCAEGSDGFDRSEPRYRLFDLTDQSDGRAMVWFEIIADSIIGEEVTLDQAADLFALVLASDWRAGFWRAFQRNKKATIYAPMLGAHKITERAQ